MNETQRIRYSRQIFIPGLGEAGQERLLAARALVVGMGGLGSAAALYLAAAGVGHLVLSDYDVVDLSNLQRQIVHRHCDLGRLKVDSARDTLLSLNPEITVTVIPQVMEEAELAAAIQHCQVVIDACDNFETRFTINRVSQRLAVPVISGAAMGMTGQIAVFPHHGDAPCYHCLYRDDNIPGNTCARQGVLASLVGMVGTIQATETLKVLTGMGTPLIGRLLLVDATTMEWRTLRLRRDPACPVCGNGDG